MNRFDRPNQLPARQERTPGVDSALRGAVGDATSADAPADVRWETIRRIRREIAAGTYETEAKLLAAVERLLGRSRWSLDG
ncbi:MAG: flagellar biosynthesis anti-sigma factor FlgM [Planctomycetota bacterium]